MKFISGKWPGALFQLHLAIFLWGFTAILGKWISLSEIELVWLRIYMTLPCLMFFPRLWPELWQFNFKTIMLLAGVGCIVAIHWVFFYGAIKRSNVSITLATFATTAIFTAFLEPLISRQKIELRNVLFGLIACAGIALIVNASFSFATGIVWGILAAFTSALFSTINKRIIPGKGSFGVTFVELAGGLLFLTLYYIFIEGKSISNIRITTLSDLSGLFLLAFGCTAIPFVISLNALRHISAFTSNLSLNLEPVYGIIMAAFIFKEHDQLTPSFYIGTLLIISTVLIHAWVETLKSRKAL